MKIRKHIPNIITVSRLLLLPLIIYLLWDDSIVHGWYAAGILSIIGIGDLMDGYIARKFNAVTNTGKIIDPMADKLTVLVSLLMLMHLNRINVFIPILILSREVIIITLRAVVASEGMVIHASTEGKRKTALQMFGLGGLFIYGDFFGANAAYCGNVLLVLSIIMSWYSAILYLANYWEKVRR
ncbi:MAG: CDP-diacylglycerol--glycerol-3-phosphate 3-phosphatidyltransferase [Pseudomonadota bacterium]